MLCLRVGIPFFLLLAGVFCLQEPLWAQLNAADVGNIDQAGFQMDFMRKTEEENFKLRKQDSYEKLKSQIPKSPRGYRHQVEEGGATIYVKTFEFFGDMTIPFEQIVDLVEPHENKEMTLGEIYGVANQISEVYFEQGYTTSYAYVPEQEVLDGIVEVEIVEGLVGDVVVRGNLFNKDRLFLREIENRLKGKILKYDLLQRIIRELDFSTDRNVSVFLKAGQDERTTNIIIDVEDERSGGFSYDRSNSGSETTGIARHGIAYSDSNLLGWDDQWLVKATLGSGLDSVFLSYSVPIYDSRSKVGLSVSRAKTRLGSAFQALSAGGDAVTVQAFFDQELYATDELSIDGKASVSHKRSSNRFLGDVSGADDLFVLGYDVSMDFQDKWGRNVLTAALSQGVSNFLGSNARGDHGMNQGGREDPDFYKFTGGLDRYQPLQSFPNTTFHFKSRWQYTTRTLPNSELFSIAGSSFVRGYKEGEFSGDRGLLLSGEFTMPLSFFPEWRIPWTDRYLNKDVQVVFFYDWAMAKINSPSANAVEDKDFSSVGFGLRTRLIDDVFGRIEWGFPQGDDNQSGAHSRMHFFVQSEFF